MKHSGNNEHAQKLADNNKKNLLIKTDKEDFKKWMEEEDVKYISKELVETPNRKVKISKLSDGIVWNIFNLRSDKDAVFPEKKTNAVMVAKACKWITDFQCYAMQVMKEDVKNKYIDIFNKL